MEQIRAKDYVVIKHTLKDINGHIAGVKFRGGYAVVERDSKTYKAVKSLPLIKNQPDLPLITLRRLPFITRTFDVKLIFGADVYRSYLKELNIVLDAELVVSEEKALVEHVTEKKCVMIMLKGELCPEPAMDYSPGGYCKRHLLEDPKIEEVTGLKVPTRLTFQERSEWKNKVIKKLKK